MCRFVAYLGRDRPLEPLVFEGDHPLERQAWAPRELLHGTVNADGFGVVWYHEGEAVRLARTVPIWHDPGLRRILRALRAPIALAALRNGTPGIPLGEDGVPPLAFGRWSFLMNGFLEAFRTRWIRGIHTRIPDDLHETLRGLSDTEALFLLLVSRLREGATLQGSLRRLVTELADEADREGLEVQLNLVLADGERIAATRASNREVANSLYWIRGGAVAAGGAAIASEPLEAEGWARVPRGSLLTVDAEGVRVEPI